MGTGHRRLGVLTVGQAPRDDVTPTLRAVLGESVLLRESGALDGLTEEGLADLAPRDSETPLETRLSGGAPVLVAEERLVPLLRAAAERLARSCDLTLLLCSGEFPALAESHIGVVQPVLVAEERLVPLLRAAAERLARSCDLTLLLCSGEFPALAESHIGVVQPVH